MDNLSTKVRTVELDCRLCAASIFGIYSPLVLILGMAVVSI